MALKFDILEYLAEAAVAGKSVKSRKITEMISHPSKPILSKAVVSSLRHLEKKKYVKRTPDMLAWRNVGFWEITKQGCDYMLEMTQGSMVYEMAKENARKY